MYTVSLVNDFSERECVVSLEADVRACKVWELTNFHHALEPISGHLQCGEIHPVLRVGEEEEEDNHWECKRIHRSTYVGTKAPDQSIKSLPFPPQGLSTDDGTLIRRVPLEQVPGPPV